MLNGTDYCSEFHAIMGGVLFCTTYRYLFPINQYDGNPGTHQQLRVAAAIGVDYCGGWLVCQ